MNAKQRWANRRTAREARDAIKRRSVAGQQWHVRTWVLADLAHGASKARFDIDPEQDPPVLVKGKSDLTKMLVNVWVSTSCWTQAPGVEVTTIAADHDVVSFRYIDTQAKEPT